jgi:hypothetical protein
MPTLLRVEVSPRGVELAPGASVTLGVRVINTSRVVERYAVTVVGPAEQWATVEPMELPLMPDTEGTVQVTLAPPAEHPPPAGLAVIAVRVASTKPGRLEASWAEELEVRISAVAKASLALKPEVRRGRRAASYNAYLRNEGNVPLRLRLRGEDQEQVVRFQVTPPLVEVGPDEASVARVRVTAPQPWTGPEVARPLTVHADGAPEPVQASATFIQGSRLAGGLLRSLGVFGAAALIAGAVVVGNIIGGDESASSPTVAPTTGPGGEATTTAASTTTTEATTTVTQGPAPPTSTVGPQSSPTVIDFSTLPGDQPLAGDRFADTGIRLRGAPETDHCPTGTSAAIRAPGTDGIPFAFLTAADPGDVTACNDVPIEITFDRPVRTVTVAFAGQATIYVLKVYDQHGQPVAIESGPAASGGAPVELHAEPNVPIARMTFGHETAITAVQWVRYER